MESENQTTDSKHAELESDIKTCTKRRKLIRAGLLGAPALLALKSTPVLAVNCKLPSGFSTSGNLSRNGGATCTEAANGPTYWPSHITSSQFTGTGISKNTQFNSIFGGTDTRSFLQVLNSGVNFASLIVAAYLDVKASSFVSGVSDVDITRMWSGTYQPPGSTSYWSAAESENYLRYAMGLPLNP